jgi:hypothetical protein
MDGICSYRGFVTFKMWEDGPKNIMIEWTWCYGSCVGVLLRCVVSFNDSWGLDALTHVWTTTIEKLRWFDFLVLTVVWTLGIRDYSLYILKWRWWLLLQASRRIGKSYDGKIHSRISSHSPHATTNRNSIDKTSEIRYEQCISIKDAHTQAASSSYYTTLHYPS